MINKKLISFFPSGNCKMLYVPKSQVLLLIIVQLQIVLSINLVQQRHQEQQLQIQPMEFEGQLLPHGTELPNEQEVQGSGQEQELQINEDLRQTSEVQEPQENQDEEKSQEIDDDLIKTYYFSDYNFTRFEESAAKYFTLVEPIKTKPFEIKLEDIDGPHLTSQSRQKRTTVSDLWSPWTSCRRINTKRESVRIRKRKGSDTKFETEACGMMDDYSGQPCKNDLYGMSCTDLKNTGYCTPRYEHNMEFMLFFCSEECGWCGAHSSVTTKTITTTTTTTTTTRATTKTTTRATTTSPSRTQAATRGRLRKVTVNINENVSPPLYMFATSQRMLPSPWEPVSSSSRPGEVAAFYLYDKPTEEYMSPVYFCKAETNNVERWMISANMCSQGWTLDFSFYTTSPGLEGRFDKRIHVSNRTNSPWASRVTAGEPCCGYVAGKWPIYSPYVIWARGSQESTMPRPSTTPYKPTNSPRTAFTRPPPTKRPRPTTTRPSTGGGGPKSIFDRECLDLHNFFRALHSIPHLEWDSNLAATSQQWATYLSNAAPDPSDKLNPDYTRTSDWPHSDKGTVYRDYGIGENIAWQLTSGGADVKAAILRWYAEIFDYDKRKPLFSKPGQPVGHYTQLVWKGTTKVGCGKAVKPNINKYGYTRYNSMYLVVHYAPGGNVRSLRNDQTTLSFFAKNVLDPKKETCLTSSDCQPIGGCMGFNESFDCKCVKDATTSQRGRSRCVGSGGCMAFCGKSHLTYAHHRFQWKSECRGQRSCECVYKPVNGRAGAICQ